MEAKERAERALAKFLDEEDWFEGAERLQEYERELKSALELEELDWEICFKCGIQVCDKAKGIHLDRGQWFGAWGGYNMAQLCGNCSREEFPPTPISYPITIYDLDGDKLVKTKLYKDGTRVTEDVPTYDYEIVESFGRREPICWYLT